MLSSLKLDNKSSELLAVCRLASCYCAKMKPIEQIRRENFTTLVAAEPSQAAFARKVGKDKNQVNQWLGRAGSRNISAETARELEKATGKPVGWLDHEHESGLNNAAVQSQPRRFDDATMTQALELLHLLADARPEDRRFQRPSWAMIQVAAKAIEKAEGASRMAMVEIFSHLEEV